MFNLPEAYSVPFNKEAHHDAVQKLVRPNEVAHLFPYVSPAQALFLPPLAERVAGWLKQKFITGEFRYQLDPPAFDYWYSPAVTLRRRAGDCEDFTLLVVSMLVSQGVSADVAIGSVWSGGSFGGHAWVEGADAISGFLIEGTSGDLYRHTRPDEYRLMWKITPNTVRRAA
ncbi:transglutaminase domain-containing protein [Archangium gephyra]|uniref:transglutaminase domain-containing protein n=1 Tax=Archangium gephyra TaxID=48 RepID=UPI003B7947F0